MTTNRQTLFNAGTQYGTVDARSLPINCENRSLVKLQLAAAVGGSPIGVILLFGSDDDRVAADIAANVYGTADTAQWTPLTIPAGSVHGVGVTPALPAISIPYDNSAVALNCEIILADLPMWLYVLMDRTSGTSNATLQGRAITYGVE
jgi:hypothetical protein